MSPASSEYLGAWEGARGALAEISACHADFDRFFSGVFDGLDRMTNELATRQHNLIEDARRTFEHSATHDTELSDALDALRRGQADISASLRATLGTRSNERGVQDSIKTVLVRMAGLVGELVETQAEQKALIESQQATWTDELAAMRLAIEGMARRSGAPSAAATRALRSPATADPVLDSVMAQFDMLEDDLGRRRERP